MRRWFGLSAAGMLFSSLAPAAPAPNDLYADRTVLDGESLSISARFLDSTYESAPLQSLFLGLEPPSWPPLAENSIPSGSLWWEWTAPRSGGVVLRLIPPPADPLPRYTPAAFLLISISGAELSQQGPLQPPRLFYLGNEFWVEHSLSSMPYSAVSYHVVKGERYLIYGFGDARSSDPVTFQLQMPGGPIVQQDPSDVEITVGESGLLSVVALGVPVPDSLEHEHPLRYSWLHDGKRVPGASNSVLPLLSVSESEAGEYRAVVTDAEGSVTSAVARVTVVAAEEPPVLELAPGVAGVGTKLSGGGPIWSLTGAPGRTYAIESSSNLVYWAWQPIEPLSTLDEEPLITRTFTTFTDRPSHVRIRRDPFLFNIPGELKPQLFLRARRATPHDPGRWVAWEALQLAKEDFARDLRQPRLVTATPSAADLWRRIPSALHPELFGFSEQHPCADRIVIGTITSPPSWGCFPNDPVLWEPNYYYFTNPVGIWSPLR